MSRILHLTNGSAVIDRMREAGIGGRIVPWDDVLHEGPVPLGLNDAALRDVRAEFIASAGGAFDAVARAFAERDAALDASLATPDGHSVPVDEIVLWFEHDLYDQLQVIQILERLPLDRGPLVTAVPDDDYLGSQPAARFAGLLSARREVTSAQRLAARDAWQAFRSPDPRVIVDALPRVTALSHLAPALVRHLQQFPSMENGLSRTEQQTLEALARGPASVREVYAAAHHAREEAVFMGDWAFVFHLRGLIQTNTPLIVLSGTPQGSAHIPLDAVIALTDDGTNVLEGRADRVRLCGIDRWLGGVHLSGTGPVWRWDRSRQTVRLA